MHQLLKTSLLLLLYLSTLILTVISYKIVQYKIKKDKLHQSIFLYKLYGTIPKS
jgi:hypothetical protein